MPELQKLSTTRTQKAWQPSTEDLLYNIWLMLSRLVGEGSPLTPSAGLTNSELRAAPVPVSGPATDAQIRASAIPVAGPVTDAQLRASAVPVSLPTGPHTITSSSVAVSGNVAAGAFSVAFLPNSDFDGTIDGVAYLGTEWQVIPFQAREGMTLPAIAYTRAAGTLKIVKIV